MGKIVFYKVCSAKEKRDVVRETLRVIYVEFSCLS